MRGSKNMCVDLDGQRMTQKQRGKKLLKLPFHASLPAHSLSPPQHRYVRVLHSFR